MNRQLTSECICLSMHSCFVSYLILGVSRDDLMLFALTCVLSSTVIYGIGTELSESMLGLLQLFVRYVKCGIGPDLDRSYLDFVLLFDDWKLHYHYPYGYHDSGTCPPIGNKMYNFRNDRLRLDGNQSEFAFRNQFFESDIRDDKDYKESVKNVTALSNGINFYKFQINKLIDERR